jgi:isopenicillin-N N-acyltransferase-like protein
MNHRLNRRAFVTGLIGSVAASSLASRQAIAEQEPPKAPDHTLTVIAGTPRERGRLYGRKFEEGVRGFLDKEIYKPFAQSTQSRDDLLRYAGACAKTTRSYSPEIAEELEGVAEGTGLRLEEIVLITLHEELYHRGVLPPIKHCTAIAAGPPSTADGNTYVGQTWDWMPTVYGQSSMLLWKRPAGPSVLGYAYPGLWIGAGLNSAGIALTWTSAALGKGQTNITGPRVGISSYILIAQILYQESLDAAIEEARRATHAGWFAGWFTFVLADGKGQLANIEGSPLELAIEDSRGHIARVGYGSRQMSDTPADKPVKRHPQCQRMCDLLDRSQGKLDRAAIQGFFGDHESTICKHFSTLDAMLFDCTHRVAYVARGPGCSGRWKMFEFTEA